MSGAARLRVAFIGVGAMGRPMATHLGRTEGIDLSIFDVSAAARQAAAGIGRVAESLAEAVAGADVVMTMVPADEHVLAVAREVAQLGWPGRYFIDFSTVHPATIAEVARLLPPNVHTVSASCMKSVAAAVSGQLTLFVGGADPAAEPFHRLLRPMASRTIDVGSIEAAKALKLINNLTVAGIDLVISEAAVIGAKGGIAYGELFHALAEQGLGGWALHNHLIKHTLTGDLGPGNFSIRYMGKDVRLAARMADDLGVPRFLAGPILAAYRGAAAMGLADHYHPVVIRWLEASAAANPESHQHSNVDELREVLYRWIGCAEWLVTRHALDLAAANGVSESAAAAALADGSAANRVLTAILDGTVGDPPGRAPIEEAIRWAEELGVPGITIEAAHDYLSGRLHRR